MQSMPSGYNKKRILVCQDNLTKYCILRALTSKNTADVTFHLLIIFFLFMAPVILHSVTNSSSLHMSLQSSRKFGLTLMHGKPHHPQSQGSVERANGDIKDMLVAWTADNDSEDWRTGISFADKKDGEKKSRRSASWRTR
ncbi:KRAB-A domain-containing protein 2-like protein [Plakobranchus ocellatus]|uniref:KRAB-A domain-containing protein 2-like protein n=1 Tax=Plakobranchus ocellatus TaxID=259542 RepID=A0AAV4D5F3_9GAST|nr:KRAB-A domain-containing protein 2-like protein [Plakobranchus ocellatus]